MRKSVLALALLLAASAGSHVALAAGKGWQKSYQGGRYEFFSDSDDLRIYIACPTADSSPDAMSNVRLIRLSTDRDIGVFKIVANGTTYDGPIETVSRVGSNNFRHLMESIRKNGVVVKYALGSVAFPQTNAAKFFPPMDDKFPCQTNF